MTNTPLHLRIFAVTLSGSLVLHCGISAPAQPAAETPALVVSWRQFRGPGGDSLASNANPPIVWSERTNVAWKVPMTGRIRSLNVSATAAILFFEKKRQEAAGGKPPAH